MSDSTEKYGADFGTESSTDYEYYDVFICHSKDDKEFMNALYEELKKRNIKALHQDEHFNAGVSVTKNIENAIVQSRRTILLLSKNFLNSRWLAFEAGLALHQEAMHEKQILIPVVMDLDEKEIPTCLSGTMNYIKYDGDYCNPADNKIFMDRLVASIKAPDVPMTATIPAGNIAHGLAWSYYYGYLRLILPGLKDRVKRSKYWNDDINERRIIPKLFILLPDSCFCWSTLTDNDETIEKDGPLEEFKANRAGNVERSYRNFVYKTKDEDGQEYYFIAEYATPLLSMYEMEEGGIAGLSDGQKMFQKQMFEKVLTDILNHAKSEKCKGAFKLVSYNDNMQIDGTHKYPLSGVVLKTIKEGLAAEKKQQLTASDMANLQVTDNR